MGEKAEAGGFRTIGDKTHHVGDCISAAPQMDLRIPKDNVGYQLLLRQGWSGNSGLGKHETGLTSPINPALKPNRRGIGKKSLSHTITVEQSSSALQFSRSASSVAATGGKFKLVKSERSKVRKERDDELKRQRCLEQRLRLELDFTTHI